MHIIDNPAIPNYRNDKVKENEANRFASEFLFPMQEAKRILPGLMLSHLGPLKKNWLISMASIIRRAYDLGIIDQNKYRYFNIELSRSGQKRNENTKVEIDSPSCFKNMYLHFKNNLNYSDEDLSKAFSLPIDIINNIFNPYELRVI